MTLNFCVIVDVSLDIYICITICVLLGAEVCGTVEVCATFGVLLDVEILYKS